MPTLWAPISSTVDLSLPLKSAPSPSPLHRGANWVMEVKSFAKNSGSQRKDQGPRGAPKIFSGSPQNYCHNIKTHLPLFLLVSHKQTAEFSRGCVTCACASLGFKNGCSITQSERSQEWKESCWFHLYKRSRTGRSIRTESRLVAAMGWEKGRWGVVSKGSWVSFHSDENVLKSESGDGCKIIWDRIIWEPAELLALSGWVL